MEHWINPAVTVVVAVLGSSGIWALIQARVQARAQAKLDKAEDVEKKMLLGLGHDKIVYLALKYIDRGSITSAEFENINKYLYEPYKGMGGNGTATRLMEEVKKLPITKDTRTLGGEQSK